VGLIPYHDEENSFMKKFRFIILIVFVLMLGSTLASCIGAGAATAVQIWPGLTIDADKQVGYVGYGNFIYAVDLNTGSEIWRFPNQSEKNLGFSAPPALTEDGQLVAGAYNKTLYSLDPQTGAQKWINQDATNRYYAGALALGQEIFAPNIDSNLYTVDNTGKLIWKFQTEDAIWSAPVTDGKVIYQSAMDHNIYALDPKTGKLIWKTGDLGGTIPSSPVLTPDGKLYVGTFNNEMLSVDATNGKVIWSTPTTGWVYGTPALDQGVLYFGDLEGTFYALDAATGQIKWPQQPGSTNYGEISGTPIVLGDTAYFGTRSGIVYAVDTATGAERWNSLQKPCCVNNGKTTLGKLYGPLQAMGDTIFITPMGNGPLIIAIDKDGNSKWSFTPAK
jgi:outer membrane protein assembly factor BamB